MGGRKMEGDEAKKQAAAREAREQKQAAAREAREHGKRPSEMGATTGASKQHADAKPEMSSQERIDLKREGKVDQTDAPEARPGSRDADTLDHERHPRG